VGSKGGLKWGDRKIHSNITGGKEGEGKHGPRGLIGQQKSKSRGQVPILHKERGDGLYREGKCLGSQDYLYGKNFEIQRPKLSASTGIKPLCRETTGGQLVVLKRAEGKEI